MINKTIEEGLRPYQIGDKLRSLRLKRKLGLVQLGQHTGLSPALLSKLERGKLFPTLPTLLRIALVFSVGLEYFFADDRKHHTLGVVRKNDRLRFPEKPSIPDPAYLFEVLDYSATERKLNAYLAEFNTLPDEKLRPHQHAGGEVIYVLEGCLELRVGDTVHQLEEGDSIYFDPAVPHSYRRVGAKRRTVALVVTTPPAAS
jgi:quercetin dioxygenase-like cupin family protein/DNA-binding XRE family transcriptional regulator